ncbi:MAG TPA: bifunctional phosphopantothenoylcysteine decarboxylase/phosphopantothenate--cysteine ligase CoaBC [Candidatus Obscuribacter sp.]|nr:bifunctional phosphopantothenoylcysteine decarboxylase/phosphopantothenate--cysteine ligase CoaBC [Candidatus Obscuribacter sp.]MDX1988935.1 bifunctional phosphopantothenoylcysteine decarboxylase/phosphopantothenate--cysteine ligase CoaBC [Candidatus Obscuribacter sp.]HMY52357.1 bifunctional phosphopantothenoylcysteine decarboxylase/phosphopantothenate--cysteine ligase CoaBC [Candidatus Obscuribacter sp.]HNA72055.1 bifunctional phosphopantothenoylcysteine decarboxylase/phosphopantothenate--cy
MKMKKGSKKRGSNFESFNPLENKTILLGVSGGIAAYKACDIASLLRRSGASVHAVLTPNAREFITPLSLTTITRNQTHCEQYGPTADWRPEHIDLAKKCDLILIAPATADIIAKLATGICDDLLTTMVLASQAKVMIAPAMNPVMLQHPATQHNLSILENRYRYDIVAPEYGEVACGDVGLGKMAAVESIIAAVAARLLAHQTLSTKRVLVTAGGTREPIDPVRFIGNRSSGKMGIAMADSAYSRGADVTLISTVDVERAYPVIVVETAQEMQEAVEAEFDSCDALVMTAAVADFRPLAVSAQKIKKTESEDIVLELTKNPDIIDLLGRVKRKDQVIIGFAAESEALLSNAASKLKRKNLDMIVGNDISVPDIGFGSDDNAVVILSAEGTRESLPRMPKRAIADHICDLLSERFQVLEKELAH